MSKKKTVPDTTEADAKVDELEQAAAGDSGPGMTGSQAEQGQSPPDDEPEERETFGAARMEDGGVVFHIGSNEIEVTEGQWVHLVTAVSAGGESEERKAAMLDFHRSVEAVELVRKPPLGLADFEQELK